jgi:excisionase family DNA binding protein
MQPPFLLRGDLRRWFDQTQGARFATAALPALTRPKRSRQPVPPDPERLLLTLAEAARRLGMSVKTLRAHAHDGDIRYVNVGRGKERESMRFPPRDLEDFIAARSQTKAPQWSTGSKTARITTTTSGTKVIDLTVLLSKQKNGRRKR